MSSEKEKAIDEEMIENAEATGDDDISDDDLVEQLDAEPESEEAEDAEDVAEDEPEDDADDDAENNGRFYDIDDPLEVDGDFEIRMEDVIEAVLFASDEPLSATRLVNVLEVGSAKQVRECIEALNKAYEVTGRPFRIEQIAGGYQMMTLSCFNGWLKKLLRV
ncbi:MAG: SMC-Scp complex subunit ScpB, partial [Planctomycetes bacterium]|nr:SMC-Scp complex subunit ScpB [Planctomycetota bacterium]